MIYVVKKKMLKTMLMCTYKNNSLLEGFHSFYF